MTDKIELTVLGCGSSFGVPLSHNIWGNCDSTNPKNYRTRPSIYLKKGDKSILIDTSPDLRHQLITNKIDTVDAVIFTHAHADHTHGINDLRSIALINKKKIPVFADKNSLNTIKNSFSYLFTKNDKHGYEPILQKNIIDNEILDLNGFKIRVVKASFSTSAAIINRGLFVLATCSKIGIKSCLTRVIFLSVIKI